MQWWYEYDDDNEKEDCGDEDDNSEAIIGLIVANLHQACVHIEPAVIDTAVVVVLEAHVEEDDEGWHAPSNLIWPLSSWLSWLS